MKVLSPFELTLAEVKAQNEAPHETTAKVRPVSDEDLKTYVRCFLESYRLIIEQHFKEIAPSIPFYANLPYEITIVRLGEVEAIVALRPSSKQSVTVIRAEDFHPPLRTINVLEIHDRLKPKSLCFDFHSRTYSSEDGKRDGMRKATDDVLHILWKIIDRSSFYTLCEKMLRAEGVNIRNAKTRALQRQLDFCGEVLLNEPGGFRRLELWGFEIKHHLDPHVPAVYLHQLGQAMKQRRVELDVMCIVTPEGSTSIGAQIAVENPWVRIWDRPILHGILYRHLPVLAECFGQYAGAVQRLANELGRQSSKESQLPAFTERLSRCPPGRDYFKEYEDIGTDIWSYALGHELGPARRQEVSLDGTHRRDVLFANKMMTPFYQRIAQHFDAQFIIVDFKNYGEPIGPDTVQDVIKYASKALGRFIVVVSRLGPAGEPTLGAQVRMFKDHDVAVLVMSDKQMLEMVSRKEAGDSPSDVLSDLLDDLMVRC